MGRRRFFAAVWLSCCLLLALSVYGQQAEGEAAGRQQATQDGIYRIEVELGGGSGKASVESPCCLEVRAGEMTAHIVWDSPFYDYMLVEDEKLLPVESEAPTDPATADTSRFDLPVEALDTELVVIADTTAMSVPHEIRYTLYFDSSTLEPYEAGQGSVPVEQASGAEACSAGTAGSDGTSAAGDVQEAAGDVQEAAGDGQESAGDGQESAGDVQEAAWADARQRLDSLFPVTGEEENTAAECFRIYRCVDGVTAVAVDDGRLYVLVPEGSGAHAGTGKEADAVLLPALPANIYLAASAAMCQFVDLGALERLAFSSLPEESWSIPEARAAMEAGTLTYAGKYSSPDYEMLLAGGCGLAVESTMILHTPKVQEKLEQIGIPVFIDRSSYERDPLGRTEWIRVYGVLTGKEEEAEAVFASEQKMAEEAETYAPSGKTITCFYLNAEHQVVLRTGEDYIAKMLETAGFSYLAPEGGRGRAASLTMPVEEFYDLASGADYLLYNTSIPGDLASIEELVREEPVFADFRAVKEGHVACTTQSVYQKSNAAGSMIREFHSLLEGEPEGEYLRLLK